MPAVDGACLVAPDGAVTCATTKNVDVGRLMAIAAPDALPLAGATITGIAPD